MLVREIILLPTRPQAVPRLGRLRLFFLGISLEEHRFLASGPPVQRTGSVSGAMRSQYLPTPPMHGHSSPYPQTPEPHQQAVDTAPLLPTCSITRPLHGAIILPSPMARQGNKYISRACRLAALVRLDSRGGNCVRASLTLSPSPQPLPQASTTLNRTRSLRSCICSLCTGPTSC